MAEDTPDQQRASKTMSARKGYKTERKRRRSTKKRVFAAEDSKGRRRKLKVTICGVEYAMTSAEYRAWARGDLLKTSAAEVPPAPPAAAPREANRPPWL